MGITLPTFTPVEGSLFLTLYCKALDSRLPKPILSDAMADEIVRKLDYDFEQFKVNNNFILNIALRSKKMDQVAAAFIRHHPDAVGLDLGAGLDTRAFRLAPPATVAWYDVDSPAVMDVRKRVVPDRPNAHVIGVDVTDPDWLNTIPNDRPAVILADGLMGFLTKDDFVSLLNRLIDHFPSGEMAFNSYTHFAVWASTVVRGTKSVSGMLKFPGVDDPRELETWISRLKLVREILLAREPEISDYPMAVRLYNRFLATSVTLSRKGTIVLHYRF
ncbi:MAG TPA: class I SAM-dependent methyltransferase [Propionibacteriaceae bacterium]|nr:class I SAM-dependent methyltransferase [Propionibacteriaceae bacterium]